MDTLRAYWVPGEYFRPGESIAVFPWGSASGYTLHAVIDLYANCTSCRRNTQMMGADPFDFTHPDDLSAWMKRHGWGVIDGWTLCPECYQRERQKSAL